MVVDFVPMFGQKKKVDRDKSQIAFWDRSARLTAGAAASRYWREINRPVGIGAPPFVGYTPRLRHEGRPR